MDGDELSIVMMMAMMVVMVVMMMTVMLLMIVMLIFMKSRLCRDQVFKLTMMVMNMVTRSMMMMMAIKNELGGDDGDGDEKYDDEGLRVDMVVVVRMNGRLCCRDQVFKLLMLVVKEYDGSSAQRVGFFIIGSGRVGYWTKYRVAGRVRVG